MTMIIAVEETPQVYPSECSFGGGGSLTNSKFLRVVNPDTATDTLLIGDTMFNEFAKAMGYVRKNDAMLQVEALRDEVRKANASLDAVTTGVNSLDAIVDSLEKLSGTLEAVASSLDAVAGIATGISAEPDGTPEPDPSE